MLYLLQKYEKSMVYRLIFAVDVLLLISICSWGFYNIKYQRQKSMEYAVAGADRLTKTIKLGTHYAMMLNSRDEITQIINNIGKQEEVVNLRIYNKDGQIKFSNRDSEVDQTTNIKDEACYICHRTDPPAASLDLQDRTRIVKSDEGELRLGIISPIYNEPGCAAECHVHPEDKQVLGALDVVMSLKGTNLEIFRFEKAVVGLGILIFAVTSLIIYHFISRFVRGPIEAMIDGTRRLSQGDYSTRLRVEREDEIGTLADSINRMGKKIGEKQIELNRQRDEYQHLFELVPCIITVQDRDFQACSNTTGSFPINSAPEPGDYCYRAYKGRDGPSATTVRWQEIFRGPGCRTTESEQSAVGQGRRGHPVLDRARGRPCADDPTAGSWGPWRCPWTSPGLEATWKIQLENLGKEISTPFSTASPTRSLCWTRTIP